jgi:amino acid transporter
MVAALNGIIVQLIMGSRILYGMASQGWIPKVFATVGARRQVPVIATLTVSGLMILGTILLPLLSLAKVTSYLALSIFVLVNLSLVIVKLRRDKAGKILQVPLVLPILGTLTAAAMLVYQIFA